MAKKSRIPIGTGRESEPETTLPAVEIKNKVVWINKALEELPIKFELNKPTKLGVFLTSSPQSEKTLNLKTSFRHNRSALLGRVIFKGGNQLYRDLDLKGIGHCDPREIRDIKIKGIDLDEAYGILDFEWAKHAKNMSEKFIKAGIRTERYVALIKINEIINNGEKFSIYNAKRKRFLPQKIRPIIALRAFVDKYRIEDAEEDDEKMLDAKKIVSQELGINNKNFSWRDYVEWFAKTAGKNLGLMHKNNWCHNYISGHNVTLDCRIVDLDSVENMRRFKREEKQCKMKEDFVNLRREIKDINSLIRTTTEEEHLIRIFVRAYRKFLGRVPGFTADE